MISENQKKSSAQAGCKNFTVKIFYFTSWPSFLDIEKYQFVYISQSISQPFLFFHFYLSSCIQLVFSHLQYSVYTFILFILLNSLIVFVVISFFDGSLVILSKKTYHTVCNNFTHNTLVIVGRYICFSEQSVRTTMGIDGSKGLSRVCNVCNHEYK